MHYDLVCSCTLLSLLDVNNTALSTLFIYTNIETSKRLSSAVKKEETRRTARTAQLSLNVCVVKKSAQPGWAQASTCFSRFREEQVACIEVLLDLGIRRSHGGSDRVVRAPYP